MTKAPLPKRGCFAGAYPNTKWVEIPCQTGVQPPAGRFTPQYVGSHFGDYFAYLPEQPDFINWARGFITYIGYLSPFEFDSGIGLPNSFSLQLNTNKTIQNAAVAQLCSGGSNQQNCMGWQQFAFVNLGCTYNGQSNQSCLFVEYWLVNYNASGKSNGCPTN
jgi:hypothetical protein